ncbi:MAG: ABC transporter permease [Peptostreptococcaceae bacterium]
MKNIMIILKHNLKSVMKGWFCLVLVIPVIMNLFVSALINKIERNSDANNRYSIGLYSVDKSKIVDTLLPKDKFGTIHIVSSKNEIEELLDDGEISVGVIFNSKDIYKDIKENKVDSIEILSESERGVEEYVLSILNTNITKIHSFGNDKAEYFKTLEEYENNKYSFEYEKSKLEEVLAYTNVFGLFGMMILMISGKCLNPLLKERELKIDKRILISKISRIEYSLGHILGCFIVLLVQSAILVISFYLFNKDFSINIGWMILLSMILSLIGIAISLIVLSLCNNSSMYYTLITLIITPMCLLSGGFVPTEFMPEMVQRFSLIFPLTWINSAFKKILMEGSNLSIGLDLLASTSISIVMIMLYLVIEYNRKNKMSY